MNAVEYLASKGVFMEQDKRRYKIIKRNGYEVYVLKSQRIRDNIMRLRVKKAVAVGASIRRCWVNLSRALSGVRVE